MIALTACLGLLSACTGSSEREGQTRAPVRLTGDLIAYSADVNGNWDFYEGDADVFRDRFQRWAGLEPHSAPGQRLLSGVVTGWKTDRVSHEPRREP